VTVNNPYITGQKVMGQGNQRLGKLLLGLPEDLRFCGFFSVSAQILVTVGEIMENHSFLPPQSQVPPFFVGTCIHANISCKRHHSLAFAGGSDPEAISKHVWPFIQSLFLLNKAVVNIFYLGDLFKYTH
jgi:hypothetical protein